MTKKDLTRIEDLGDFFHEEDDSDEFFSDSEEDVAEDNSETETESFNVDDDFEESPQSSDYESSEEKDFDLEDDFELNDEPESFASSETDEFESNNENQFEEEVFFEDELETTDTDSDEIFEEATAPAQKQELPSVSSLEQSYFSVTGSGFADLSSIEKIEKVLRVHTLLNDSNIGSVRSMLQRGEFMFSQLSNLQAAQLCVGLRLLVKNLAISEVEDE